MAVELNLTLEQNATYSRTFAIQNAGGSAYNLTDCTVQAMIRKVFNEGTPDEEFHITYDSPRTLGTGTMLLSAAEVLALSFRKSYFWDMLLIAADGTQIRCFQGTVEVSAAVTHD